MHPHLIIHIDGLMTRDTGIRILKLPRGSFLIKAGEDLTGLPENITTKLPGLSIQNKWHYTEIAPAETTAVDAYEPAQIRLDICTASKWQT